MRLQAARTDAELVAAVRSGEGDALAEIDRRYRSTMLAVAAPILAGTGYDAEDAVQDALLLAQRALRRHVHPIALRPWLAAVVRNRAVDLRRRRHGTDAALPDELPARGGDPADAVAQTDELRQVVAAIGRLPERQRAAIVAQAFEGATSAELAGRLGTSVPGAKALVHRARSGLAVAA